MIVILDNHGYASIGSLSESVGSGGFGTEYRYRDGQTQHLSGETLPLDFAANAASLGAQAIRVSNRDEFADALVAARTSDRVTAIVVETDRNQRVGGYESWWDVPIAEVSQIKATQEARAAYDIARQKEQPYL